MFSKDIGIDLGTASILVYVKGKGVVLREPSVVAIDKNTGKLLKVGTEAQQMLGRTPGNIVAIRPLREGVISDYDMTERMLKEFIRKVTSFRLFKPRIVICVPSGITEVEERAVIDAGIQAGARRVYLIEEPVAAAIGAGIDIAKPDGHMIVDIGGGTTDIASIKIAGDQFDEAIVKYIRRKHNVLIGERTAEELKMQIGCVFPRPEEQTVEIKGRCLMTGVLQRDDRGLRGGLHPHPGGHPRRAGAHPPGAGGRHLHQRHLHDRRRLPGLGLRQAHRVPHRHRDPRGRRRHLLRGLRHRQEPGRRGLHAGRHHQPVPPQADELSDHTDVKEKSKA